MLRINIKRAITIFLSVIVFFCVSLKLTGALRDFNKIGSTTKSFSLNSEPGIEKDGKIPQEAPMPNDEGEEKVPEEETKEKTVGEDTFPEEPAVFQKFTNAEIIKRTQKQNKFSGPYYSISSPPPRGSYLPA